MTPAFRGYTYLSKELEIAKGMEAADSTTVSFKAREPVIHKL